MLRCSNVVVKKKILINITKAIVKKVANIHQSEEKIKYNNIYMIAQKVNQLKEK